MIKYTYYKENIQNKKIYACAVLQELYEILAERPTKTLSKNMVLGLIQCEINDLLGGVK